MAATLRVLRNHWKKTVFFSAVGAFGLRYAKKKYEDTELLREYCAKALQYGNVTLNHNERPRKVIVFLNPAAKKSSSRSQFEKNVLPLLNLAGLEVTVVKTEHEGQAKAFMAVLDDNIVDAVVVAGGDGTVSEIVTGLLRRPDQFASRTPVGVLPLGDTNSLAQLLLPGESSQAQVRFLCEAAMAIIRNVTRPVDVMEVTGKADKPPVYAVSHLKWGLYSEAEQEKSKYWYFGPLKQWYSLVRTAWEAWPSPRCPDAAIGYSLPCVGCSRCYTEPDSVARAESSPSAVAPWWRRLASAVSFASASRPAPDPRKSRENPECGKVYERVVKSLELSVLSSNHAATPATESGSSIRALTLKLAPEHLPKAEFVSFRRRSNESGPLSYEASLPVYSVAAGSISIVPAASEGTASWFIIDSENFEAMPVNIKMIRNALQCFCPGQKDGSPA